MVNVVGCIIVPNFPSTWDTITLSHPLPSDCMPSSKPDTVQDVSLSADLGHMAGFD